ncbi:MAG TPA: alpha/beta hydrolase [Pseudomonas sabulinigri]|uniref:AB hydrolase-1 domain-containing protein n=1 Tax=marine sediment metagenome TaxID=412755 RepID=A0A0F9TEQ7_9ZZZZ|nr:alpha/beta hydrolase [Halopseudomonas sabulinigri]HEC53370.1 alpha/beta hydrolase [Halopseudomonas sabulinigri]
MPDVSPNTVTATTKANLASQLPPGIRSRQIDNGNGLNMHILEAGFEQPGRECVLLLHGFPELAYTWRKIMLPLAEAGYHVVAPDQRGYGLTEGSDTRYEGDISQYRLLNMVRDVLGLVFALGYKSVAAVVGRDIGSPVAATCALTRPDVFCSVALMSAPYPGVSGFSFDGVNSAAKAAKVHQDLAALTPPRLHYQRYLCMPDANAHMLACPQGMHDFLRAYYHMKSADWAGNDPAPLASANAADLATMPEYYVMAMDKTMPETVAAAMPSAREIAACDWLPDEELAVYSNIFSDTGLQGGLQWYRALGSAENQAEMRLFAGKTITVPSCFLAGASDWGIYQSPGAFEAMQSRACSDMRSCDLIPGAGHWLELEKPQIVIEKLLGFLASLQKA